MTAIQIFRTLLIVQLVLPIVSRLTGATHPASHPLASHFAHPHIFHAVGLAVGIADLVVLIGLWRFQSWARVGAIILLLIVVGFTFYAMGVGFVGRGSFGMMYLTHFVTGVLFAMMFLPAVSLEFRPSKGLTNRCRFLIKEKVCSLSDPQSATFLPTGVWRWNVSQGLARWLGLLGE